MKIIVNKLPYLAPNWIDDSLAEKKSVYYYYYLIQIMVWHVDGKI